jgi:hypothetical protein
VHPVHILKHSVQSHRRFQTAVRKFMEEVIMPDATLREEDGKRPSQAVFDAMARVSGPLLSQRTGSFQMYRRTF